MSLSRCTGRKCANRGGLGGPATLPPRLPPNSATPVLSAEAEVPVGTVTSSKREDKPAVATVSSDCAPNAWGLDRGLSQFLVQPSALAYTKDLEQLPAAATPEQQNTDDTTSQLAARQTVALSSRR